MDIDLPGLLAVTALVMAAPGPSVLYAVAQRLQRGRLAGTVAVLGLETGLLVHVLAACLGISALIAASPALLTSLRLVGAGYLAVLGLGHLGLGPRRRVRQPVASTALTIEVPPGRPDLWRVYRSGVLVDLLNPKSVLFFLALLPQFLPGRLTWWGAAVLVGCVVGLGLLFDGGYAALAGRLRERVPMTLSRWGSPIVGCGFLVLAATTVLG